MTKVRLLINTLEGGGAERAVSNISLKLNDEIEREIYLIGHEAKVSYPYNADLYFLDKYTTENKVK